MIDQETFTTTQVMQATNTDSRFLRDLFKSPAIDELVSSGRVHSDGVKGKERNFSFSAMMAVAVVKALADVGIPPKKAMGLAARYAFTDDTLPERIERSIGKPCHPNKGVTYLVTNGTHDAIILRADSEDMDSAFQNAGLYGEHSAPARLTLNVSEMFWTVMRGINRDPDQILAAAYPTEAK